MRSLIYYLLSVAYLNNLFPTRYHNGTLLDQKLYKYEGDLVLRDLKPEHTGMYYCKANSLTGTIKSNPAFLTVLGKFVINSSTRII